jgi:hypothetical protein
LPHVISDDQIKEDAMGGTRCMHGDERKAYGVLALILEGKGPFVTPWHQWQVILHLDWIVQLRTDKEVGYFEHDNKHSVSLKFGNFLSNSRVLRFMTSVTYLVCLLLANLLT